MNPDDGMLKFPGAVETNINRGDNQIRKSRPTVHDRDSIIFYK